MGQRGPHPKPTALRVLQGDKPYRINRDEPKPADEGLECPSSDPATREVWDFVVYHLQKMKLDATVDRDALLCYCEAVVNHREASRQIAEDGIVITNRFGDLVRHPATVVQREAAAVVAKYAHMFGFTPSARSEIRMGNVNPGSDGASDASRLLTG